MVVTSNSNVGIKIYDKNNKEIKVNGGELPTDMGKSTVYGEKSGSVTFQLLLRALLELAQPQGNLLQQRR